MPYVLVLYRFGEPQIEDFVRRVVVPAAEPHFQVLTILNAFGQSGDAKFWFHIYQTMALVADAFVSIDFAGGQSLSVNRLAEARFIANIKAQKAPLAVFLANEGVPEVAARRHGDLFHARIDVGRTGRAARLREHRASSATLHLNMRKATPASLGSSMQDLFKAARRDTDDRAVSLLRTHPAALLERNRLRAFLLSDPALRDCLECHNGMLPRLPQQALAEDPRLQYLAHGLIHDPRMRDTDLEAFSPVSAWHGRLGHRHFYAYTLRLMERMAGPFVLKSRATGIGLGLIAIAVALVTWPLWYARERYLDWRT